MIWVGLAVAGCAAALHVFIFYLESFAWTTRARGVFGTSVEEAQVTRELAFNQGFYNLFLAIIALVGVVIAMAWSPLVGVIVALESTAQSAELATLGREAYASLVHSDPGFIEYFTTSTPVAASCSA